MGGQDPQDPAQSLLTSGSSGSCTIAIGMSDCERFMIHDSAVPFHGGSDMEGFSDFDLAGFHDLGDESLNHEQ